MCAVSGMGRMLDAAEPIYTFPVSGSDRVRVAGVMMSRDEAAEVEAKRAELFGPRVLRKWRRPSRHETTSLMSRVYDWYSVFRWDWPDWMLPPPLNEADREFRRVYFVPLVVLGVVLFIVLAFVIATLTIGGIRGTAVSIGLVAAGVAGWLSLYLGLKAHLAASLHRRQCRAAMRRLGWRVCSRCRYFIGREGPAVCPECGLPSWSGEQNA